MNNIRKHIKDIIIIALLITCIAILVFVIKDINELYKHIDILNLFYRNLGTGTPVWGYVLLYIVMLSPRGNAKANR